MSATRPIVILSRCLELGGAERQAVALARELARRGRAVRVVVFYPGGPLASELTAAGIPAQSPGKKGRWDLWGFGRRLVGLLRQDQRPVILGYLDAPNLAALALRPLLRGAAVVWGVRASNMDLSLYGWLPRLNFRLNAWLSGRADLIIANSQAGRDFHVARGYPAARTVVVPNGVDTDRFRPDPAARARQRAAWGVADHEVLVGLCARLDPMKDHGTFLAAAALAVAHWPELRLVCVGGGPADYARALSARAHELGLADRLIWAGPLADMTAAFNALDLHTSASAFGEGFSNTLAEALACGVPSVATAVGDAAEILGDLGLVVPPGGPAALAAGWRELWDRRQARGAELTLACRQRVRERFGLEALARRTLAALAEAGL